MSIEQIVHEELSSGWNRIIKGVIKRVRKRLNLAALSGEQIKEIEAAMRTWFKE